MKDDVMGADNYSKKLVTAKTSIKIFHNLPNPECTCHGGYCYGKDEQDNIVQLCKSKWYEQTTDSSRVVD